MPRMRAATSIRTPWLGSRGVEPAGIAGQTVPSKRPSNSSGMKRVRACAGCGKKLADPPLQKPSSQPTLRWRNPDSNPWSHSRAVSRGRGATRSAQNSGADPPGTNGLHDSLGWSQAEFELVVPPSFSQLAGQAERRSRSARQESPRHRSARQPGPNGSLTGSLLPDRCMRDVEQLADLGLSVGQASTL
jgi:hypothetical protein